MCEAGLEKIGVVTLQRGAPLQPLPSWQKVYTSRFKRLRLSSLSNSEFSLEGVDGSSGTLSKAPGVARPVGAGRHLEKVKRSDWAAPIVCVPKKDGEVRICGDYKVTVMVCEMLINIPYPSCPDDIFATLTGGKCFTTLDFNTV